MICSVALKVWKFGLILTVALMPLGVCAVVIGQDAASPKAAPPKTESKAIRLPPWAAKADWKKLASPFEEALAKGGAIVLQLPRAFERQVALANNKARAVNGVVAVQAARVVRGNANQQMEQQVKALIPQYRNQYINVLHGELQAIRSYCEVPKESREEVYKVAEEAYDKSVEEFVRSMYFPNERGRQQGSAMRSSVRNSIVKVLEQKLPAAEFAKLRGAVDERSALRKRICTDSVIARMDDTMRLTPQQREKIAGAIKDNWSDDFESWLMLWQYEDNYLPVIDDSLIVTHLTPQQRRIWQQAQKISLRGEMYSEFAGEFDAAYWNAKPANIGPAAEGAVIELVR